MRAKPVIPRQVARQDVILAFDHYADAGGDALALRFLAAVESAFRRIGRHPAAGSPRHGVEVSLDGLRTWQVRRFPYLIFYLDRADHVDVWRVLQAERDLAAWLREGM